MTIEERLWEERAAHRIVVDAGGCWIWQGPLRRDGYGELRVHGQLWLAHRFAYVALVADVPADLTLDHLCRERSCVNPDHLEPVTRGENVLRGELGTVKAWRAGTCMRGHPRSKENAYWRKDRPGAWNCRACCRERDRKRVR
jgi:hypothetical protein